MHGVFRLPDLRFRAGHAKNLRCGDAAAGDTRLGHKHDFVGMPLRRYGDSEKRLVAATAMPALGERGGSHRRRHAGSIAHPPERGDDGFVLPFGRGGDNFADDAIHLSKKQRQLTFAETRTTLPERQNYISANVKSKVRKYKKTRKKRK